MAETTQRQQKHLFRCLMYKYYIAQIDNRMKNTFLTIFNRWDETKWRNTPTSQRIYVDDVSKWIRAVAYGPVNARKFEGERGGFHYARTRTERNMLSFILELYEKLQQQQQQQQQGNKDKRYPNVYIESRTCVCACVRASVTSTNNKRTE